MGHHLRGLRDLGIVAYSIDEASTLYSATGKGTGAGAYYSLVSMGMVIAENLGGFS
jgi:hypothetical protein